MRYVAVGAGAVLGATLRYAVTNWAAGHWGGEFPYGTLLVTVSGAFVIGMLLAVPAKQTAVDPLVRLFVATGFLGGFTTFSAYAYAWEALTLAQDGAWSRALFYVGGSNVLGLAGVWVGSQLMTLRGGCAERMSEARHQCRGGPPAAVGRGVMRSLPIGA